MDDNVHKFGRIGPDVYPFQTAGHAASKVVTDLARRRQQSSTMEMLQASVKEIDMQRARNLVKHAIALCEQHKESFVTLAGDVAGDLVLERARQDKV